MQKTARLFLSGRICAELCKVYLGWDVVRLCTCITQASLSTPSCSFWLDSGKNHVLVLERHLGHAAGSQLDSWDAGDGQALCTQVRSVVQSITLRGRQVSIEKVLYWGLELKAVSTPYLVNLGASRPEVMVKDMAKCCDLTPASS